MKNIFVEGIQGMGKSTLTNEISRVLPKFQVCREGDYSPVDLAWCAWLSEDEYNTILKRFESIKDDIMAKTIHEKDHVVISYTQIITDVPNFHKELEQYEVYNGRKTMQDFKKIIFSRYENFQDAGYIFECSFFQNIIEDLILFHLLSDDEIVDFYHELYQIVNKENFLLFYLYSDKLEENIKAIQKERCDNSGNELWYPMMLQYLIHSPYGAKHGYQSFDDMISHFMHRQKLELRIIKEVIGDNIVILPAKKWNIDELLRLISQKLNT